MNKNKRYVDVFCEKLDMIFEDNNPTKAQIIDAFHKTNPLSLARTDVKDERWNKYQRAILFIIGYLKLDYKTDVPDDMDEINFLAKTLERYMNQD